jgi:phosphate transport system protein
MMSSNGHETVIALSRRRLYAAPAAASQHRRGPMGTQHIVKSYDDELKRLTRMISEMGGLVETQLAEAIQSIKDMDAERGQRCKRNDAKIDALEAEIESFVVRLLALRQPMARDLRSIVGALEIASDLERIGDYAANAGKRVLALSQMPPVPATQGIVRLGNLVRVIVKDVLDAFVEGDTAKALAVWQRDEDVDAMYTSLFREILTYMIEDARNITACTHLLFIAKNFERMGDHTTNIAETVHFFVTGEPIPSARPKGDDTSYMIVTPTAGEAATKS